MGFAKGDTRAAAGDEAGIDGGEAIKEAIVPGPGASRMGDGRGVFGGIGCLLHPVVQVGLPVDGGLVVRSGHGDELSVRYGVEGC